MTIDGIRRVTEALQKLEEANSAVFRRQEHWSEVTRPLIKATFESINATAELKAQVAIVSKTRNAQEISLTFPNTWTEFSRRRRGGSETRCARIGGWIAFRQGLTGHVSLRRKLPYVKFMEPETDLEIIDRLEPQDIDENRVAEVVAEFLEAAAARRAAKREILRPHAVER